MRISYEERDGRTYAYRCTSKRVPGRRNPVSRKEYLGVVDPGTGEIVPKDLPWAGGPVLDDGAVVTEYGNTLIAWTVAERLGIPEDLEAVFGGRWREIMALALAMAVRPSRTDTLDQTIASCGMCEMLGIPRMRAGDVRRVISELQDTDQLPFFTRRWEKVPGGVFVYGLTMTMGDPLGDRTDMPGLVPYDTLVLVMISMDGMPHGYAIVPGPDSGETGIGKIMGRLHGYGVKATFVSNAEMSHRLNLREFINNDIDFIIPHTSDSEEYRILAGDFKRLMDVEHTRTVGGNRLHVMESTAGLRITPSGYRLIPAAMMDGERYDMTVRSCMVFDPRIRSRASDILSGGAEAMRAALDGKRSDDPERTLWQVAGPMAQFLKCETDEHGHMKVVCRKQEVAEFRDIAGKVMVLSSTAGWDRIVLAHRASTNVMSALGELVRGPGWSMEHLARRSGVRGHLFVELLALMIYTEMRRTLDAAGERDLTIADVFYIASTYRRVESGGGTAVSSRSRRVSKILRILGIEDPNATGKFR